MIARAVLFAAPNVVETRTIDVPDAGERETTLTALATAVSAGTELRCLRGDQPNFGLDHFPFVPGYAFVGRNEAGERFFGGGTKRASVNLGWGGHIERAVAPTDAWIPVPDGVASADAALAKLAAIAYRGVRLSRPSPHETVAVFGLGPIGAMAARLHAVTGARVVAFDPNPLRRAACPVPAYDPADSRDVLPHGADVVVDATGHPAVATTAIGLLKKPGWNEPEVRRPRFVVQGSYAGDLAFDYHAAFFAEAEMLFPRDSSVADARLCLDLMARGLLRVDGMAVSADPADAPATYAKLKSGEIPGAVFDWTL